MLAEKFHLFNRFKGEKDMRNRILSGVLAAVMAISAVGFVPAKAEAATKERVSVILTSGASVEAQKENAKVVVYDDYSAKGTLTNGYVDVTSIGVDLTVDGKNAKYNFKSNSNKDVNVSNLNYDKYQTAVVNATVNGKAVKYTVKKEKGNEWTATPENTALVKSVAQAFKASYVKTVTGKSDKSSYLYIPEGAYVQAGTVKASIDEDYIAGGTKDSDKLFADAKAAVAVNKNAAKLDGCQIKAYVPAGAIVKVRGTETKLKQAVTVKVSGIKEGAANQNVTVEITTADYEKDAAIKDANDKADAAIKDANDKADAAIKDAAALKDKLTAAEKELADAKDAAKEDKEAAAAKVAQIKKALKVTQSGVKKLTVKATKSYVNATWSALSGASKYKVVVLRNGKSWRTTTVTKNSYKFKKTTGYKYTVEVTPVATVDKVDYVGIQKSKSLTVKLSKPSVKITKKGCKVKVKLKSKVSNATGYQVRIATKKSMKKAKKYTISSKKKFTKKYSLLGKKTYVQVRAYKTYNKQRVYSSWTSAKLIRK